MSSVLITRKIRRRNLGERCGDDFFFGGSLQTTFVKLEWVDETIKGNRKA